MASKRAALEKGVPNEKGDAPDELQRAYDAHHTLYRMVRSTEKSVCDFVNDFANQYLKFQQVNGDIHENLLAVMLLSACALNTERLQMIMANLTVAPTYLEMQTVLTRSFGEESLTGNINTTVSQGEEEVFITKPEAGGNM